MSTTEKVIRLSRVIRQLNLSLDHIVVFLAKKGFRIERNPNSKISGEAYSILVNEFRPDKLVKEEFLAVARQNINKSRYIVIDKPVHKEREMEESRIMEFAAWEHPLAAGV